MDRIQFINNIQYDLKQFKLYFNKFMILYDLVYKYENITISIDETNSETIFNIVFNNNTDIDELGFNLNNLSFINKYGVNYDLLYNIDNNILHIMLNSRES